MTHTEIIKAILTEKKMTLSQMARIMGKSLRLVSDRVNTSKSINLKNLEEMLDVLDYKVVIMPKSNKTPKDGYEIRVGEE